MNEKSLKTLEYTKIIGMLADYAGSKLGRERCLQLLPVAELSEVQKLQTQTSDALARLFRKGSLSFSGIPDTGASGKRLEVGATLCAAELMAISSLLTACLRIKNFGTEQRSGAETEYQGDSLTPLFQKIEPLTPLQHEIARCVLSEEEIADDASAGLRKVRRAIKAANDKIHEQLSSVMNHSETRGMMQDALITMRNGRYCLPIRSEFKNQFQGMVHDQSSSGSTVFIEPMAIVKLNNELRELSISEKDEIEKVLAELSSMASEEVEIIANNRELLTELDFIFARASLSRAMAGSEPVFNDRRCISIKKGRHPLIEKHKVVPIDIRLGDNFNMLVITGPNTGGKTVTLKTLGLFTLMGQAGLHIPAAEGSRLGIFENVFADIGDEQSIEQSLSTFSSHMTNTVSILEKANRDSLVLFDELGAGTDPTEGAALAMAILTHLHHAGVRTAATTHYSELKIFALSTSGVSNACCEFDVETLRPTYRLLIGIPGKSNAFAISQKLGLPEYIIDRARSLIGAQEKSFEDVISDLERDRVRIENEKEEMIRLRKELEEQTAKAASKNERLEASREKILKEAKEQARDILQEAKTYADETIRRVNKLSQGGAGRELEAERGALRDAVGKMDNELGLKSSERKRKSNAGELSVGQSVLVISLNLKGRVSTLPNAKGDFYVQMGSLRSLVNISDVELAEDEIQEESKKSETGKIKMSKSLTIHPELNIIGKRVDEALPLVDKYLDDAYLAHLPQVTIIHGRGTGALRDCVHAHLKKTKYVKSYRVGGFGEGDHGVTIVEFKE